MDGEPDLPEEANNHHIADKVIGGVVSDKNGGKTAVEVKNQIEWDDIKDPPFKNAKQASFFKKVKTSIMAWSKLKNSDEIIADIQKKTELTDA